MKVFVVNAFAENGFSGNPAGVCFTDPFPNGSEMGKIAEKAGFSETAFIQKHGDGFFIRWFTPQTEVSLCGHATLAAAHTIWRRGHEGVIVFDSTEHKLSAEKNSGIIEMDFPADREKQCAAPADLARCLGTGTVYSGKNSRDYLVELKSEDEVVRLRPDFEKMKRLDCRGVIVTSPTDRKEYDFVSRFFAPRLGIDEDPVTGSAHCCLAPYWSKKTGKTALKGLQVSHRGGVVYTEFRGERVKIGGKATAVGVLNII